MEETGIVDHTHESSEVHENSDNGTEDTSSMDEGSLSTEGKPKKSKSRLGFLSKLYKNDKKKC